MFVRAVLTLAVCSTQVAPLSGSTKKPQPIEDGVASDPSVSIRATIYNDPANIQQLLGDDLGGHYIVIKIDLSPIAKYSIDRDDFLLRTDKDGERAKPYEATQIAGDGALVVTTNGDLNDKKKKGNSGITLGGAGMGMGSSPGMVDDHIPVSSTMKESTGEKNPILKTLAARILPNKEVDQNTSGLLYFPMERQKIKDLELIVTTPKGKLHIRFSK